MPWVMVAAGRQQPGPAWMQERETRFLDALYLGVRDRHGFDVSLNMLCGLFDVPSAALLDFDAARPEVAAQATVGPFSGAFVRRPGGTAISTDRLLAEEKRKPGAFFSEFFRPLGLEECLGGTIASAQGRFAMVGLHRTPDRQPFDDADIAKLEALMPHLARALQLRRSFLSLERTAGALSEVCDRLAAGVVTLDEQGRSLFVNSAARAMAAANDGLSIDRGGRPLPWTAPPIPGCPGSRATSALEAPAGSRACRAAPASRPMQSSSRPTSSISSATKESRGRAASFS
jgi:GAF domain-containing protein